MRTVAHGGSLSGDPSDQDVQTRSGSERGTNEEKVGETFRRGAIAPEGAINAACQSARTDPFTSACCSTRGRWEIRNGRSQDGLDQSSSGSNSFAGIGVSRANFPSWIYRFLASGTLLAAMQAMKITAMKIMPRRTESSSITSPKSPSSLSACYCASAANLTQCLSDDSPNVLTLTSFWNA